ncbi:hypothetical protein H1V43_12585 [Streptomyces sp. PSKA54]|uniref:Periplasmic binding protein/LacI sugar binding domain-containing protein n=1 Tax=Streptomyces himalayensis subsp. aureolus TaxID=2758039 RepID=A0A7W2D0H8_9ACTN|nr:hypothetical protein [Streptomyces himalayensis]MBA4862210.1 hypothetical protein [Streptomyces himalayensis subsp. aureolus]
MTSFRITNSGSLATRWRWGRSRRPRSSAPTGGWRSASRATLPGAPRLEALLQLESTDGILSFTTLGESVGDLALADFPVPIVVDGVYDDNMRSVSAFADASMAADLLRHLADRGHRRFVHVAGHPEWASAQARRAVYEATIADLGLESCAVVEGDWSAKHGWKAATEVIADSGATAVFAAPTTWRSASSRACRAWASKCRATSASSAGTTTSWGCFFRPALTP